MSKSSKHIKKLIDKLPDRPEHKIILENIDQLTIHNIFVATTI